MTPTLLRAALLCIAALVLHASPAHAQSCCGVASEDELSVAGWERRAVLTSKVAVTHMLGRHDTEGTYRPLTGGFSATDAQLVLGAGVRMPFYEPLQVHGSFPVRLQYRSVPDATGEDTATVFGPGDALLFLRWSALRDDEIGPFDGGSMVPSLDLYAGGKAPTGRHEESASARDQARTMGDGTFAAIFGARAVKHVTPVHAVRLSARYELHGTRDAQGESFHPGNILGLAIGYLGLSGMHWAFGGTIDLTFTSATSDSSEGEREVTLGAHVTRTIAMPDLDLTLGVTYAPPIDGLSENTSLEGIAGALTLRWHWMAEGDAHAHMHH